MAGKIFINYRRDDERAMAARVRDRLAGAFGAANVFMDVDNLVAGQRFDKVLEKALTETDVFLAVIGPRWMKLCAGRQSSGERDYVREEIAGALKRDIIVIPVLIDRTPLPRSADIYDDIRDLFYYQKHDISHEHFGRDIEGLVSAIKSGRRLHQSEAKPFGLHWAAWSWLGVVIGVLAIGYVAAQSVWTTSSSPSPATVNSASSPIDTTEKTARAAPAAPARAKAESSEIKQLAASVQSEKPRDPALSVKPGAGQGFRDLGCDALCPEMVVAPAGEFLMGSTPADIEVVEKEIPVQGTWFRAEAPQSKVIISRPFAAGRTHITRAEFAAFVAATGHKVEGGCYADYDGRQFKLRTDASWLSPTFDQNDLHPVVCVMWRDVSAYVTWLSQVTGRRYRLLSDAEAEYLARTTTTATSQPRYFFGNDARELCSYGNGADQTLAASTKVPRRSDLISPCTDGFVYTAPVGSFQANKWGIHDAFGNVYSWTADWWNATNSGAPADGSARIMGDASRRVIRGGAWVTYPPWQRAAFRSASGNVVNDRSYTGPR